MAIHFFYENSPDKIISLTKTRQWIKLVLAEEKFVLRTLNFIFCDDAYLLEMNQNYLQHDTLTDIITFDNSESVEQIEGDIFISTERVNENSLKLKLRFEDELHRVIIHGVLHLAGYSDKTADQKVIMREKENSCLSLRGHVPRETSA